MSWRAVTTSIGRKLSIFLKSLIGRLIIIIKIVIVFYIIMLEYKSLLLILYYKTDFLKNNKLKIDNLIIII